MSSTSPSLRRSQRPPRSPLERHPEVDLLINNAGVTLAAPVDRMAAQDLQRVMDVNFWGAARCTTAFLPARRSRPVAGIVNVLSQFALWGFPTKAAYCASKFALRGFTESLQAECTASAVRVTAAYPGAIFRIGVDAVGIDLLTRLSPAGVLVLLGRWQQRIPFLRGGIPPRRNHPY
jgi:NAD(P)-dependent dehydrogenase (short-subunit alcohol dehydrogenase family)